MNKKNNVVYLSEITPENLQLYIAGDICKKSQNNLYNDLKTLTLSYPNFEEWYMNKVIPELKDKKGREVVITLDKLNDEAIISGIVILKKTSVEKKICTIRVHEKFRQKGIGSQLFEESFKFLETRKPLITISENNIKQFEKHIEKYEFQLNQTLKNHYKENSVEYVYNGVLKK